MRDLVYYILRMEDYTEIMPVILYYFAIDWANTDRLKQAAEELDEAIDELSNIARLNEDKSGIISYYLHDLKNSQKRVKECINTVQ